MRRGPLRLAALAALATLPLLGEAATARADARPSAPTAPADGPRSPADAILGRWSPPEREVTVELAKSGAGYVGTVVWAKDPAVIGKQMFRGVTYDGATWRGEVYAPKRHEYVPMTLRLKGPDGLLMTAGSGLMAKDLVWTRV